MGEVRHVLHTDEISPELVLDISKRADQLRHPDGQELLAAREDIKQLKVGGMVVYVAMFEPSTRTADAQTRAAYYLGMDVRNRDNPKESSSLVKGETKQEMIINIVDQDYDSVVIRDRGIKTPDLAAAVSEVPVINAGNGWDDHPTQAISDAYTIWRDFDGQTDGHTIVIAGDNFVGRVNRAEAKMLGIKFRNKIIFVSPPGLEIQYDLKYQLRDEGVDFEEASSLIEVMEAKPNAIWLSRFQEERYTGENFRTGEEWDMETLKRQFQEDAGLTPEVFKALPEDTKVYHPLPMGPELRNILRDISEDRMEKHIRIRPQVKNGIWGRVAIYEYLYGTGPFKGEQAA